MPRWYFGLGLVGQPMLVLRGDHMLRVFKLGDLIDWVSSYPDGMDRCSKYQLLDCLVQTRLFTGSGTILSSALTNKQTYLRKWPHWVGASLSLDSRHPYWHSASPPDWAPCSHTQICCPCCRRCCSTCVALPAPPQTEGGSTPGPSTPEWGTHGTARTCCWTTVLNNVTVSLNKHGLVHTRL